MPCADVLPINGYASINTYNTSSFTCSYKRSGPSGKSLIGRGGRGGGMTAGGEGAGGSSELNCGCLADCTCVCTHMYMYVYAKGCRCLPPSPSQLPHLLHRPLHAPPCPLLLLCGAQIATRKRTNRENY